MCLLIIIKLPLLFPPVLQTFRMFDRQQGFHLEPRISLNLSSISLIRSWHIVFVLVLAGWCWVAVKLCKWWQEVSSQWMFRKLGFNIQNIYGLVKLKQPNVTHQIETYELSAATCFSFLNLVSDVNDGILIVTFKATSQLKQILVLFCVN